MAKLTWPRSLHDISTGSASKQKVYNFVAIINVFYEYVNICTFAVVMVFVYSWFANVTFLKAVCNAVYAADCKCLCANSVKFFEYSIPFSTNSNTQLSTLTMPGTICSDRSLGTLTRLKTVSRQ